MDAAELAARNGIGERIKAERLRLGLTPEQFADKTEISRATVFNYESGVRMPDALVLQRMSQLAGVDVLLVLTGQRTSVSTMTCSQERLLHRFSDLPAALQTVVDEVAHIAWLAYDGRRDYDYNNAFKVLDNQGNVVRAHEPEPKGKPRPR